MKGEDKDKDKGVNNNEDKPIIIIRPLVILSLITRASFSRTRISITRLIKPNTRFKYRYLLSPLKRRIRLYIGK